MLKLFAASVLVLALAGCKTGGLDVSVKLPHAPQYYAACFNELTDVPIETLTRDRVVRLVADLRRSEKRLSRCGHDLLKWYDTVRLAYAKKT